MHKVAFLSALALALTVSGTAFAQSPASTPNPSSPSASGPPTNPKSALTIEKVKQGLQNAGFTNVKVLEDAFLIQAKTKDGNPILMTIGPNGMRALEVSNSGGNDQAPTAGQNQPNGSVASVPSKPARH